MRTSLRPAPSILAAAVIAAVAAPAVAQAATTAPKPCTVVAPPAGSIKIAATPTTIVAGTQPRLGYVIKNNSKHCVGVSAAPYGIQISGFAGWSNWQWDLGILPQYIRVLQPGESTTGLTARVPANLSAGGYYRFVPHFTPDSAQPVASVRLTVVPPPTPSS